MKPDEIRFLLTIAAERPTQTLDGPFATEVGERLGIHAKRADYLLNKWIDKGWWECGVTARSGWLTEAGLEAAAKAKGGRP